MKILYVSLWVFCICLLFDVPNLLQLYSRIRKSFSDSPFSDSNHKKESTGAVAYAGFWKGGGQKFQKIWEEQRSASEVVPLKFSLIFRPNLGEEHKKKGLRSNFVPFFGQILVKSKKKKKKKKKRSLLKVRPVFHPNSLKFPAKSLKAWCPTYKGGGHASILLTLLCNFAILATQREGPWPNGPPLNTPLDWSHFRKKKKGLESLKSDSSLEILI